MDVLFALMAFAAIVIGLVFGFLSRSPQRPALVSAALPVAAAIATVSMLGSLYYSEIRGFTPCELCWYQRIAMYSLAIILVVAVVRRDTHIAPYAATLSVIGFGISTTITCRCLVGAIPAGSTPPVPCGGLTRSGSYRFRLWPEPDSSESPPPCSIS